MDIRKDRRGRRALSFADWNRDQTARICADLSLATEWNVRRARRGPQARLMLWSEYVAACEEAGLAPEPF